MIYTLTLNTAIDMNIRCDEIKPNFVNRTTHTEYSPNGKAVNVSIVLNKFGGDTTAIGIFGGFSGKYIVDELNKMQINTLPVYVEETTRINVFINDGNQEYKLVGQGPFVSDEKQNEILTLLNSLTNNSYLVISGSLPNNIQPDFYDKILALCEHKNINVILDISHPHLKELLKFKPLLIKPNDDELKEIFNLSTENEQQVIHAINQIHKMGAQNIMLTMGSKGLYFSNQQNIWFCDAVKINLISSACAGDSSLAAFLSEWITPDLNQSSSTIEFAMKKASAVGANVAESNGIGLLDKFETYIPLLTVKQL